MRKRVRGGFTLAELIVTLAVVAIVMAVAIPGVSGLRRAYAEDSGQRTLTLLKDAYTQVRAQAVSNSSLTLNGEDEYSISISDGTFTASGDKVKSDFDFGSRMSKLVGKLEGSYSVLDNSGRLTIKYTVNGKTYTYGALTDLEIMNTKAGLDALANSSVFYNYFFTKSSNSSYCKIASTGKNYGAPLKATLAATLGLSGTDDYDFLIVRNGTAKTTTKYEIYIYDTLNGTSVGDKMSVTKYVYDYATKTITSTQSGTMTVSRESTDGNKTYYNIIDPNSYKAN